jgi:hypothetical protein
MPKGLITELKEYVIKNSRKGYTIESLRWALINQGYSKLEIEKAIKKANEELANRAPILKTKPVIKHEVVEPDPKNKRRSLYDDMFGEV